MSICTRTLGLAVAGGFVATWIACSNGVPLGPSQAATAPVAGATTTTTTTTTPAPTPTPTPGPAPTPTPGAAAVAYSDLVSLFAGDCTPCHGGRSPKGRYSTESYTGVMAAVRSGSASSPLVIVSQPGGSMYGFLSGDRAAKAALVRTWVLNGAPQTR